jgi:hypothetical protein
MIRLVRIDTEHAITCFVFEYDLEGEIFTLEVNEHEIIEKAKKLESLLGRKPTVQDLEEIIIQIVNEVRIGKTPFLEKYDYSGFIGKDLEAEG